MAQLINLFQPELILVAHELHANGANHLHAYVKLKGPYRTHNSRFADIKDVDGTVYHGNYQGCRSSKNVLKYCSKEDDYVSNFDLAPLLAKRSSRKEHMESLITGKRTLDELIVDEPQYLFHYSTLTKALKTFKENQDSKLPPLPPFLPNPWGKLLPTYYPESRKQRHFWIFSTNPNAGKTTWADFYGITNIGQYWKPPKQLIIFDEFNFAKLKFYELNAIADGTYGFRRFGEPTYEYPKGSRPIVIVLSNLSIRDVYPFMYELIETRFKQIDISGHRFI